MDLPLHLTLSLVRTTSTYAQHNNRLLMSPLAFFFLPFVVLLALLLLGRLLDSFVI